MSGASRRDSTYTKSVILASCTLPLTSIPLSLSFAPSNQHLKLTLVFISRTCNISRGVTQPWCMFGYFWGWRRGCCNCSPDVFTKDVRSENSWTEKYNGNFSLTVSRLDSFVWPLTLETICFKIFYKKCKIMIDVLEKWTPLSNDMILLHSSLPCFSSNYNSSKELGMFIYLHIISPV